MVNIAVQPPQNNDWAEHLRFYCQTCKADDPTLDFMVGMWSYALHKGGLTGKQAASAEKYLEHRYKELGLSNKPAEGQASE